MEDTLSYKYITIICCVESSVSMLLLYLCDVLDRNAKITRNIIQYVLFKCRYLVRKVLITSKSKNKVKLSVKRKIEFTSNLEDVTVHEIYMLGSEATYSRLLRDVLTFINRNIVWVNWSIYVLNWVKCDVLSIKKNNEIYT